MNNKVLVVVIIVIALIAGVFALRQYQKNKLSGTPSQTIEQQSEARSAGTTELDDELKDLDNAIGQQSVDDVDLNF